MSGELPSPDVWALVKTYLDPLARWVFGPILAGYVFAMTLGYRAGKQKRKYEELVEEFVTLKAKVESHEQKLQSVITEPDHRILQTECRATLKRDMEAVIDAKIAEIKHILDNKINAVILDARAEIGEINANLCLLLGASNLRPVKRQRFVLHGGDDGYRAEIPAPKPEDRQAGDPDS